MSALLLLACSASGPGLGDAGLDAGDDGHDGISRDADGAEDAGAGDGQARPDFDPRESLLLVVPGPARLCTTFSEARDWRLELAMAGRIALKPGCYVLPRQDGASSEGDLVESVLFGPQRRALEPIAGPGIFEVVNNQWQWYYAYHREYTLDGQAYRLTVHIMTPHGQPDLAELVLDEAQLASSAGAVAYVGPGESWTDEVQTFVGCELPADYGSGRTGENEHGCPHEAISQLSMASLAGRLPGSLLQRRRRRVLRGAGGFFGYAAADGLCHVLGRLHAYS